ncbi:MAG: DNA mismatch repair protein MutS [Fibrobacteres bacterium]|nr:DNA mismatch repair protein MutS [Fibrobacterota bacterium]
MSATPMMKQYLDIKSRHPGSLLLYRMGDFYELFNEDAVTAAKVLGLTLTSRNHGGTDKTPLAGFPYHAIERYMPKLIAAGIKVAVCEQVEDPAEAKGVVRREVTEVVTRGTAINENYLDAKSNNYLAALWPASLVRGPDAQPSAAGAALTLNALASGASVADGVAEDVPAYATSPAYASGPRPGIKTESPYGLAYLDLSTGRFVVMEGDLEQVANEIYRLGVQEVLFPEAAELPGPLAELHDQDQVLVTALPKGFFNLQEGIAALARQFKVHSLEAFDCGHMHLGLRAAAAALAYVKDNKKSELDHLVRLTPARFDSHMTLDAATIRNLELIRPMHGDDEQGTLFHLMDRTVTAMGGRAFKFWLTHPLLDPVAIRERQDAVQELLDRPEALEDLRKHLQAINDMERIVARCGAARAHGRDLQGLGFSMTEAGAVGQCLESLRSPIFARERGKLAAMRERGERLLGLLTERPPLTVREGGMIRAGAFPELDTLVHGISDGREWLNGLQAREREATGIHTLKVGYNKVFGYYIEVTKAQEDKVPPHYLRKQSLVGAERYITPEMKEWESRILGAEGEINSLEYKLFCGIRDGVSREAGEILEAARVLGMVDVLCCLAKAARDLRFTRPILAEDSALRIVGGRHPVVESITEEGAYIANDVHLDAADRQILLITGPNMAGKSTYLRQVGLIALLAQIGSFVPADEARIGIVDRIFTRVGATDRLAKGQSTFMVEMIETANILNHATPRSLILLDEIGRGTSTYDGLSLAWAITEALHQDPRIAARTLFATHYHELTQLAQSLPRLRNVQVTVKEADGQVIFLRKVIEGGCDSSYGIHVAKMAGVPDSVIERAWDILAGLESHGLAAGPSLPAPDAGHAPAPAAAPSPASGDESVREAAPGYSGSILAPGRKTKSAPQDQIDLFQPTVVEIENPLHRKAYEDLLRMDLDHMSPMQAMLKLHELKARLSEAAEAKSAASARTSAPASAPGRPG